MPALAHLGVGFIAKYLKPKINVWILLGSAMVLDILTIIFNTQLWPTHGLLMAILWSIIGSLLSLGILFTFKERIITSYSKMTVIMTIGLTIFSHWILDFIGWPMTVIDPTLTGTPFFFSDNPNFGLGVYSTWFGALTMDIGILIIGLVLYIRLLVKKKQNPSEKIDQP